MKIAKVVHQNEHLWSVVEGDLVYRLEGDRIASPCRGRLLAPLSQVRLLAPVDTHNKIVGLLGNYTPHKGEFDGPGIVIKPMSAVMGPGDSIIYPKGVTKLKYEAELAIVMRRRVRRVSPEEGKAAVLGYTVSNDVTALTFTTRDRGESARYKAFDTFAALEPWIVTGIDGDNLGIRSLLNGKLGQDSHTSRMTWSVGRVVAWVSSIMTLEPGDIISTGTPPDSAPMEPGDRIECAIDEIGVLANSVVAET